MRLLRHTLLAFLGAAAAGLLWVSTGDRPLAEATRVAQMVRAESILSETAHNNAPAPALLVQAFVASDDPDFFEGPAWRSPILSYMARLRLAEQTPQRGQGAVARILTPALIAVRLDLALTHEEILQRYLGWVYFGRNCFSAAAASLGLFATPLDRATEAELLALASLPRSPTVLSGDSAQRNTRVAAIIARMAATGAVDRAAALRLAALPPAEIAPDAGCF